MFLKVSLIIFPAFVLFVSGCNACNKNPAEKDALHADQGFSFPKGFPADPGDEGRRTLEGVDSDHDGLRDDVQRWIYSRHPTDEAKRKALRQEALSFQKISTENLEYKEMEDFPTEYERAISCLISKFADIDQAILESEYLRARILNTKVRSEQYLKNDAKFDGKTLGPGLPDDGSTCEK